jgi:hypothetical protein
MINSKLKTSLIALSFGLGLGLSSTAMAAWTPTPQQCAEMEEQCFEEDNNAACINLFEYC